MFRTKICGVRLEKDVKAVEDSGGDAIGLNFFPSSVRFVDPDDSKTAQLSGIAGRCGLLRVGVFVNEAVERMEEVADQLKLDAIQLHGDESDEVLVRLVGDGYRVIRAVKLPRGPMSPAQIDERSQAAQQAGCQLLLDVDAGASHGGSGKTLHWPSVAEWAALHPDLTWTLAGGLTPENVAEAIATSGAKSVDTASGVECPRGVKNAGRIAEFIAQAG